jgi:hypothetical protein
VHNQRFAQSDVCSVVAPEQAGGRKCTPDARPDAGGALVHSRQAPIEVAGPAGVKKDADPFPGTCLGNRVAGIGHTNSARHRSRTETRSRSCWARWQKMAAGAAVGRRQGFCRSSTRSASRDVPR